jgi:uncharacterized protein YceH (UPF0502 family)
MRRNLPGTDRHDAYFDAVKSADRSVDAQISAIRRREDAGEYTSREAADARIEALEAHLATLRQLREEHLGGD